MDEEIADDVEKYGYSLLNVSDARPPFRYSVGLMKTYDHPELIVFGLDSDNSYYLFDKLIQKLATGIKYNEPGIVEIEIDGTKHRIGLRRVHETQQQVYLGFAMGFCRRIGRWGELEAMQVFWPDSNGLFPFEAGCELDVFQQQPRIDLELTPREIRKFERRYGGG